MPTILGLDLSLLGTGMCVLAPDGSRLHSRIIVGPSVSDVRGRVERLIFISEIITDTAKSYNVSHIIIEAPAANQKFQAAAIGEIHGVVKTDLHRRLGVTPMVEQATKMRKAVVGKISSKRTKYVDKEGKSKTRVDYGVIPSKIGSKTKRATVKDIIEARLASLGILFDTQDEMDAYVTARFAWNLLAGKTINWPE